MGKTIDVGVEHINRLNIKALPDANSIYKALGIKYGKNKARRILDDIYEASEKERSFLYDKKNANYDVAMIFSGGYDANIIRYACNWVAEHKEFFGDEILEVGCDCGFMTTFLGSFFPHKKIVALDRNEKGLKIAQKNVEKFGLTNVTFINADVSELPPKTFDTFFSMRTMHENDKEEKEAFSTELIDMANMYTETVQEYAALLSSLVKKNGTLISIERMGMDSLFLAWIQALLNIKMLPIIDSFKQIKCSELDDTTYLEALVYQEGNLSDIKAIDLFEQCFNKCTNIHQTSYEGWDAKVMFELNKGKIIKGYEATFTESNQKTYVVLCEHKSKENCLMGYQNRVGYVHLDYFDTSNIEGLLKTFSNSLNQVKGQDDVIIRELE